MNSFFDLIDRHKIGILTTIVLHLLIITIVLVIQMRAQVAKQRSQMIVEFINPEEMNKVLKEMENEIKQKSQTEFIKEMQQEYNIKSIAVNEAEKQAEKSIDDMQKQIKDELGINENYDRESQKDIPKPQEIKKIEAPKVEKKTDFINEKGEPSVFRGATTISYNLKGRNYVYIPTPQYKCEYGGKVVLDVTINQKGFVLSASINHTQSQITEECIAEAAIDAARKTLFSEKADAPAKQAGTITFIFVAQ